MGHYRNRTYKCADGTETIVFNGREYHRQTGAKQKHRRRYFWGRREPGNGKKTSLHVAVWEYHNGPVPEGHVIHHIDDDPLNNDVGNLQCLTIAEHSKAHATERNLEGHRHKRMYRHQCDQCGAPYESWRKKRTRFCSKRCQQNHYNARRRKSHL